MNEGLAVFTCTYYRVTHVKQNKNVQKALRTTSRPMCTTACTRLTCSARSVSLILHQLAIYYHFYTISTPAVHDGVKFLKESNSSCIESNCIRTYRVVQKSSTVRPLHQDNSWLHNLVKYRQISKIPSTASAVNLQYNKTSKADISLDSLL